MNDLSLKREPHLFTVIKNYCEDATSTNGLFLLDMPTGFGKTHSVLDYIFNAACSSQFEGRKIFFITTLKKNLPIAELEKRFRKAGKLDLFKEKFLFIDSNADCVIANLTSDVIKTIPNDIKYSDEYKTLVQDVIFLQNQQKRANDDLNGLTPSIRENLRRTSEPNFRRYIQTNLAKQFRNSKDRIYAIKTNSKWQWLGKVYPAVFTKERQIIFMSVDKFLSQNSTIVEPSSMFYNSSIIKDAIIFIDEFDATKDTVLRNIIQNGLRDKVDYLNLFREIYGALQTSKFPSKLTTPSRQRKEGPYKDQSLQSVINRIKEKADEIYKEYSLQFSHKTSIELVDTSRNFLFQDHQFHSILDANKSYIVTTCDNVQQINTIHFSSEKPTAEHNNIQVLLGKLRGFIKYFQGGVNILAINYQQCKAEQRKDGEDDFTLELAIRTVLAEFWLSDFHKDYITSQILIASHKNIGSIAGAEYDLQFYEKGFRYYAFLDEPAHDMRSSIMMYGFQNTPEKILLRFCEKAKVIGISATATVSSVIGNYDLDYLKSKMQFAYKELSEVDKQVLTSEFSNASEGYNNINIITKLVSGTLHGEYTRDSWGQVFANEELIEWAFNFIEQQLSEDKNSYNKERYLRISIAYKAFLTHEDIQSFLCVLTKHPRKGDKNLDLDVLLQIFEYIHKETMIKANPSRMVCQLDGEEYDLKKDSIQKRLEAGEKLFVISVYQTIGAGQNLQYKIPSNCKNSLIATNGFDSRGEKDFDAIYLDKPTHILVKLGDNLTEEDFVKYIFQMEFLQEAAELSSQDAFAHIKKAFVTYYTGYKQNMWVKDIYKSRSAMMLATRTIIQAIGRICRTNQKRPNIYIFADSRLSESMDFSVENGRLLNPEFIMLINKLRELPHVEIAQRNLEDAASLLSVRVNKYINNLLGESWSDDQIKNWKKLRGMALRYPTMTKEDVEHDFVAKNFYIKLLNSTCKFWYKQENDYNNIRVSFSYYRGFPLEVSETAARLDILMSIKELHDYFVDNGFATSFTPNEYMMSPTLFNNIYKGALGEVVGKYFVESRLEVSLAEITNPDYFELFDYQVKGTKVFIDFKHWEETTQFLASEMLEKIAKKALQCEAVCVIVINILASRYYKPTETISNGIRIVEIPGLLYPGRDEKYKLEIKKVYEVINEYSN